MKLPIILILLVLVPICFAVDPPKFGGLVGGKIDPSIDIIKNANVYSYQQDIVIEPQDPSAVETVIVEYLQAAPVTNTISVEWSGYETKYRRENIIAGDLSGLVNSGQVVAVWKDLEPVPMAVDCYWGGSTNKPTSKEVWTALQIDKLWNSGYKGKGIYVMVVDTGVDPLPHLSISGELTKGKDYSSNKHGSSSASTIASNDDNYPGIAPEATIVDCAAIPSFSGQNMPYSTDECFDWAIQNFEKLGWPQIISNSWGFISPVSQDHAVVRKIKEASDKGIIVVMAATNCGGGCSAYSDCCDGSGQSVADGCVTKDKFRGIGKSIHGPNQLRDIITVAAVDATTYVREGYSSQGPSFAPGGDYVSEKPNIAGYSDFKILVSGGAVKTYVGTSAATPTVSGGLALLLSAKPDITPMKVREILYSTADKDDNTDEDVGFGLMDYFNAVTQASINVCGNGVCESGETMAICSVDCKSLCDQVDCDDGSSCTQDYCDIQGGTQAQCVHIPIYPCCGNSICEYGETIWGCPADCDEWQCKENCEYSVTTNEVRSKPEGTCAPQCTEFCGDTICDVGEDSENCAADCKKAQNISAVVIISISAGIITILLGALFVSLSKKRKF